MDDDARASQAASLSPSPEVVARLLASHRDFLRFLTPRVSSPAVAEDILQAAFVRSLEKGGTLRDDESSVAWFYRVLRNALTDHYRRRASEERALQAKSAQPEAPDELELRDAVCACVNTLLPTLKDEYAEILRRVDLEEEPVQAAASALQITANNAAVRLHRARQALRKQVERSCGTCATHGCLDCTCSAAHG